MIISGLDVQRFGPWQELRLTGLCSGLNVLYVPDPDSRSALAGFVPFVLCGLGPEGLGMPAGVNSKGSPRGGMIVSTSEGTHRLHRSGEGGMAAGLTIAPNNGQKQNGKSLRQILRRVHADSFRRDFVISRDVQAHTHEANSCRDEERWFDFASSPYVGPSDANGQESNRLGRELGCESMLCRLSELMRSRKKIEHRLRQESDVTRRYANWSALEQKINGEIGKRRAGIDRIVRQLNCVDLSIDFHRIDGQLNHVATVLASTRDHETETPPIYDAQRSKQIEQRIDRCRHRISQIRDQRSQLRSEIRGLTFAAVHTAATRARSLLDQGKWLPETEAVVLHLDSRIGRLGSEPPIQPSTSPPPSASQPSAAAVLDNWDALCPVADRLRAAAKNYRQAKQQDEEAAVDTNPSSDSHQAEDTRQGIDVLREPQNRANLLRRYMALREHVGAMDSGQKMLRDECVQLRRQQTLPGWALCLLAAMFAGGIALVSVGVFPREEAANWGLMVIGMTVAVAAALIKLSFDRLAHDRLNSSQHQLQVLSTQMDQAIRECEAIEMELGGGGLDKSPAELLEETERELVALQRLQADQTPDEESGSADRTAVIATARKEYTAARRQWRAALMSCGLPADMTPRRLRDLQKQRSAVTPASAGTDADVPLDSGDTESLAHQLSTQRGKHSELLETWRDGARELLSDLGQELAEDSVVAITGQLRQILDERCQLLRRRGRLIRKHQRLRRNETRLRRAAKQSLEQRREQDERHNAARAAEADAPQRDELVDSLVRERDTLQRKIQEIRTQAQSDADLAELLVSGTDDLVQNRSQCAAQLEAERLRLQRALQKRSRCRERIKVLAEDRCLLATRLQLSEIEESIRQTLRDWQTAAVSQGLLRQSQHNRETHLRIQSRVRHASSYLARLSEGQLTQLAVDSDRRQLKVQDQRGQWHSPAQLHPYQRDTVHLCLRLAQVRTLAEQGSKLPVLIDDVLPASNGHGAIATAQLLCDFAQEGHQLIFFTSDTERAAMFAALDAPVADLGNRASGQVHVTRGGFASALPTELAEDASHGQGSPPGGDQNNNYQVLGPVPLHSSHDAIRRLDLASLCNAESEATENRLSGDAVSDYSRNHPELIQPAPALDPSEGIDDEGLPKDSTSARTNPAMNMPAPEPPRASTEEPDWWPD